MKNRKKWVAAMLAVMTAFFAGVHHAAAEEGYLEKQMEVAQGTYYQLTLKNDAAVYEIWDEEQEFLLADEKDAWFCTGDREIITVKVMTDAQDLVWDDIALEEALVQPNHGRQPVNVEGNAEQIKLVDAQATDAVRSLYAYLMAVGRDHLLFGHQMDNSQSIVKKDGVISDTYHTVGAYPAVTGFEMSDVVGHPDRYVQRVQEAYQHNSIATLCDHMPNFSADEGENTFYDMTPTYEHIMPGGKDHEKFLQRLDQTAEFVLSCKDGDGELIPIIYRPFHENSGNWFWWGSSNTTKEEFVALWRFTVEYLCDVKGVHNLLYAYSPNGHFAGERDYLDRYPGDEYVDVIGFDVYHDSPEYGDYWMQQTLRDAQIVTRIAAEKGKVAALTEVGVRYNNNDGLAIKGNEIKNWYTLLAQTLMSEGDTVQIAYMMTWRNQDKAHFWVPYDDGVQYRHEMANDFTAFYNRDDIIFADRMGNFGQLQEACAVEEVPAETPEAQAPAQVKDKDVRVGMYAGSALFTLLALCAAYGIVKHRKMKEKRHE